MKVIKTPNSLPFHRINGTIPQSVFLAGSIEMGKAIDWQKTIETAFVKTEGYILNPRRDDWDSNWVPSIKQPEFYEQVSWELSALDAAQVIAMYFDENTKSQISLLELGLYAKTGKMIVCCPDGFCRKGNVDIVCERYNIVTTTNLKDFISKIHAKLRY